MYLQTSQREILHARFRDRFARIPHQATCSCVSTPAPDALQPAVSAAATGNRTHTHTHNAKTKILSAAAADDDDIGTDKYVQYDRYGWTFELMRVWVPPLQW